jgi:hypothetical protein
LQKVAQIQTVSIQDGERFYLRALLLHKPALSFLDLCTIKGHTFDSFHEAACDIGLFENQNEGYLALREAIESLRTPSQLRFLFSEIILEGYAAMPLWLEFQEMLSIDHIQRLGNHHNGYEFSLQIIDDLLSHSGKNLADFGLPSPPRRSIEVYNEQTYLQNNHAVFEAQSNNMSGQLNAEQQQIVQCISESIVQHRNNFFFIEGCPGRGKTFLVKALSSMLRAQNQIVLIVGSSALSATAYDHGRMAHHMFGIPVTDDNVNLHSSIHPHSPRADLI